MTNEIKKRIELINRGEVPMGYKKTAVGIVPQEWENKKLKNIGKFSKGKGLPGMEMKDTGVPCIGYGDIYTKYNFKFDKAQNYVSQEVANDSLKCKKNSLFFTCSGETAMEIGKCVCYTGDEDIYVGGDIAVLIIAKDVIPLFVGYQQNILSSIKQKARYGQGHSVVHIYSDSLGKLGVVYPKDTAEQQRIADILSKWDEAVSLQEKLIEKLELQKKALMQKLLTPKEGWEPVPLKNILKEISIKTKINNQYDVISSTKQGLFLQIQYFDKQVASEDNVGYKVLKLHQIVISPQNLWLGNLNYNDKYDIGIVSPSYKIFDINDMYNKAFISTIMQTPRMLFNYIHSSEQGASIVRRNLNMDLFYEIVMHLPCKAEQDLIANKVTLLKNYINLQTQKLEKLKQQQKAMQQLLLTGIVRV